MGTLKTAGNPGEIALVHDFLFTFGGAEQVLLAFHELYPEAPIHTLFAEPRIVQKYFPNARIITSPLQRSWLRSRPHLLLTRMPQAIEWFDFSGYEVVLSSSGAFSHGVITGPETTHVCYCHSPMRYAWDYHREYLGEMGIRGGLALGLAEQVLSGIRIWDSVAAERVDRWLSNGRTVSGRIKKFYGKESTVVYPPVNTDFFDPSLVTQTQRQGHLLTVSRLTKNKRVDLAIKACAAANLPLHIAGAGKEEASLRKLARSLQAEVTFLGRIDEVAKRQALAEARGFIFAAEDDFGIAPVEALSMGTPVIALGKGGATETIQHGANGRLFGEPTVQALQEELLSFTKHGVSLSAAEIRATALRFSSERFKKEIANHIDHAFSH